jgi:alkanesulfonate monooxygenase SsuD/methylene tetrahydromethanopterin reductase-like flavin-dependent oxidoreductase (luciferase family)
MCVSIVRTASIGRVQAATSPLAKARLGLLLPPMLPMATPGGSGPTSGGNVDHTVGSTQWVSTLASAAEDAGAAGVWASDHLFWNVPVGECLTTIAVAAAATRTAAVGTCVLQLPLRAPAAVAKQAAALQLLSGGRFVLGVGVGSHPGEYQLAGAPFHTRGKALDAGIAVLHAAWATAGRRSDYCLEPAPAVPLWVGGSSPAAIRRAAAVGDGWVPLFVSPNELASSLAELEKATAAAGRSFGSVFPAVVMVATVGDDTATARAAGTQWLATLYGLPAKAFHRHLVAGPAEHCALAAARYMSAGAAHVIVLVADDDVLGQFRALAAAYDRLGPSVGSPLASVENMAGVGS